jgi:hypothetical protein
VNFKTSNHKGGQILESDISPELFLFMAFKMQAIFPATSFSKQIIFRRVHNRAERLSVSPPARNKANRKPLVGFL